MTLAVNPGTRYLAIAVFYGHQLLDWRIKVLKGRWSEEKLDKALSILDAAIDRYRPDSLAIKKLHPSRSSENLNAMALKIRQLALRHGLTVREYSINRLEEFICDQKRKNKRNLAEAVAANYPELYSELHTEYPELTTEKKKKNPNPYHIRMFEAVALGAMCADEFDNN